MLPRGLAAQPLAYDPGDFSHQSLPFL
jgi:hypothetical protein